MEDKEKKKTKPFLIYVALGLLIFFGVQQYNENINSPTVSTFSEFKDLINNGDVVFNDSANTITDLRLRELLV